MNNIFFSEEFYEYKDGFANGVVDFIISYNNGTNFIQELEYKSFWDLGYLDAYNYYTKQLAESNDNIIEVDNMLNIIIELFIIRSGQINEINKDKFPAFTLILKLNDKE